MHCTDCQHQLASGSRERAARLIMVKLNFAAGQRPIATGKVLRCTACRTVWNVALAPRFRGDPAPGELWTVAAAQAAAGSHFNSVA